MFDAKLELWKIEKFVVFCVTLYSSSRIGGLVCLRDDLELIKEYKTLDKNVQKKMLVINWDVEDYQWSQDMLIRR